MKRKTLLPSSVPAHYSIELSSFNRKEFPLMLAAAFATENRNPNSRSLLKRLLRSYLALITAPARSPLPHFLFLPSGLLSLLPLLLTSSCPSLAALSAEVVGAAAVSSLEANLTIVSDKRLVAGLVMAVGSRNQRVAEAACNALMDLSASSNGRERLREFSVIEKLLWEGFAHIALHCWSQKRKQHSGYPVDYEMMKLRSTLVNMLHVTVKLIANESILFKKACLVGGHCFTHHFNLNHDKPIVILKQKNTFYCIIETIRNSSSFSETFTSIVTAVHENNVDFFQWMRWLRHLHQEGDEKVNFDNPFELFEEFVLLNSRHVKEIMMEFSRLKSEFCESVVFEDTCDEFLAVLEKYRKCRTQYMNGMMSLHTSLM